MAKGPGDGDFLRDWEAVRADQTIQFSPLEMPKTPETAGWIQRLFAWLGEVLAPVARLLDSIFRSVGLSWGVGRWILLALVVAVLAYLLFRRFKPLLLKRQAEADEVAVWAPERVAALGLLEDADRLAAAGDYGAATHLLLQRSVAQIDEARPGLLHPSSTAREISVLPALPDAARQAFGTIAARVERSLFALRSLDAGDWQAARAAYAEFALGSLAEIPA